jgi:hypothetical protein
VTDGPVEAGPSHRFQENEEHRMRFTIQSSKGSQTFDLPSPGGTLCFGVGDPANAHSSVWMVKARANKSDVYVGNDGLADYLKFSLHRDNRWHNAWTQEEFPLLFPGADPKGRRFDRWQRPDELGSGWTLALRVWVLEDDLIATGPPLSPKRLFRNAWDELDDIFWAPPPEPGTCWGFHVWLGRPDRGVIESRNMTPLGGFTLREDREGLQACFVMLGRKTLRGEDLDWLASQRRQLAERTLSAGIDITNPTLRSVLFVDSPNGVREVFDLALAADQDLLKAISGSESS